MTVIPKIKSFFFKKNYWSVIYTKTENVIVDATHGATIILSYRGAAPTSDMLYCDRHSLADLLHHSGYMKHRR